jgi:hypothetical protein
VPIYIHTKYIHHVVKGNKWALTSLESMRLAYLMGFGRRWEVWPAALESYACGQATLFTASPYAGYRTPGRQRGRPGKPGKTGQHNRRG